MYTAINVFLNDFLYNSIANRFSYFLILLTGLDRQILLAFYQKQEPRVISNQGSEGQEMPVGIVTYAYRVMLYKGVKK